MSNINTLALPPTFVGEHFFPKTEYNLSEDYFFSGGVKGGFVSADNGEIMADLPTTTPKSRPPKSLGRPEFDKSALTEFQAKSPSEQKEVLKTEWADLAFILAERAKRFSMTVSRKDFGRLQQLATTAGIAYDKIFPKGDPSSGVAIHGNVMFNLFGNLGQDKIMRILTPQSVPQPVKEIPDERAIGDT